MTGATILLIDDDATLSELLSEQLRMAGYRALSAGDGASGLRAADEARPDLVILDVMMPGMDGWTVCERLRAKSMTPIILLTAKGEEIDKLRGFRLGVDDYVTKPFSFAEMVARVGAVLARAARKPAPASSVKSDELLVDFELRRVSVSGNAIDLTPTEYRLLEALARYPQRTIPTEKLIAEVWGPQYAGEVEQVKHFIWTLRKKLEVDPGDPKHIITERGFGYRFE